MKTGKGSLFLAGVTAVTLVAACGSKPAEETVSVIDETHFDQLASSSAEGQGNAAVAVEVLADPAGIPSAQDVPIGDSVPDAASAPIQASAPTQRIAIRPGSTFEEKVQSALRNAGFYNGEIDGKIGQKTREAIRAFQSANNLKVDGVVGTDTWERLRQYQGSKT